MTRRRALNILGLAPATPALGQRTTGVGGLLTTDAGGLRPADFQATRLYWALDTYKEFIVSYKGEQITIDPAELFAALKKDGPA